MPEIVVSDADAIRTIRMDRPEKKNALTLAMYAAMTHAIEEANTRADVRSLLIAGHASGFCAGNDLSNFLQMTQAGGLGESIVRFLHALARRETPLVAAVAGKAVGIGTTMLLHCDLVYVNDEARLAMPFVSLGLVPEFASSLLAPQLLGRAKAAEKLLLGDPFTGAEAVECGIANAVLPAGEVVNHARRIAERFNALPPGAVVETKRLLRRGNQDRLLETIRAEGEVFARRLRSPEAQEAFSAFFQKRKPDFSRF
jgi:enoyl-CoA hydratase/carnithine racemase